MYKGATRGGLFLVRAFVGALGRGLYRWFAVRSLAILDGRLVKVVAEGSRGSEQRVREAGILGNILKGTWQNMPGEPKSSVNNDQCLRSAEEAIAVAMRDAEVVVEEILTVCGNWLMKPFERFRISKNA